MLQFVPLTDEMLYSCNGPPLRLVPYQCGLPCVRDDQRCTAKASPGLMPSLSAMPALSSSTYCAAPSEG